MWSMARSLVLSACQASWPTRTPRWRWQARPLQNSAGKWSTALESGVFPRQRASRVHSMGPAGFGGVPDMDADPQRQFPLRIGLLDCLRGFYRLHSTGELDQEAVTNCLKRPSSVLGNCRFDNFCAAPGAGPTFQPRPCRRVSNSPPRRPPISRRGGAVPSFGKTSEAQAFLVALYILGPPIWTKRVHDI